MLRLVFPLSQAQANETKFMHHYHNLAFRAILAKQPTETFTSTSVKCRKSVCVFSTESKLKEPKH